MQAAGRPRQPAGATGRPTLAVGPVKQVVAALRDVGRRARLQKKKNDVFVANFRGTANLTGGERLAEDDSISSPALPVDLGKGQAVIVYRLGGEAREMTVDVQTRPMIPYPECPPPRRPC